MNSLNLDFSNCRILVIGDAILDKYYYGKVNRISPEAPVPVINVTGEKESPGGSGNVVNNISSLGARSFHISLSGKDENAYSLNKLLNKSNVQNRFIETENPTVTKIRIIGEHQQVVRLDFERPHIINDSVYKNIIHNIDSMTGNVDAVIVSDYGKGICTQQICRYIIDKFKPFDIPVIVDPKGYDWDKYKNAALITPNVRELSAVSGREIQNNDHDIEKYGLEIMKKYSIKNILVTRSDKGMTLITGDTAHHIPTDASEVYDVSGAGDTVVATLAVGLALKMSILDCAKLANRAAGIVVNKFGTAPVELEELIHSFREGHDAKLLRLNLLSRIIDQLFLKGKKIVLVRGKFHSINLQTVKFLKEAKNRGDVLIVGIENKDETDALEISEILSGFELVDYVIKLADNPVPDLIKDKVIMLDFN